MRIIFFTVFILFQLFTQVTAQSNFTFAIVTDTHIDREVSIECLKRTVNDINSNPAIGFVLVTGDLTSNGNDKLLHTAEELLKGLTKKYYAIPGNHEDAWSQSGGTSFNKIFGNNRFAFEESGYQFIGTDCGPMLRHGLAHIPKDHLKWLDETLSNFKNPDSPIIFVNHYPMNASVDNDYEAIGLLKKRNIQLILCGHGHRNKIFDFSGIPGIMCRTNLPINNKSGYTIVNISNGIATFTERIPGSDTLPSPWAKVALKRISKDSIKITKPDYSVNKIFKQVKVKWEYQDKSDMPGSFTINSDVIYSGTYQGELIALRKSTGEKLWSYYAGGRIYATPAVCNDRIVFTSTNGNVYCISLKGELIWTFKSKKAIVSSPVIQNKKVFVGFSDGSFRCLDLEKGTLIWDYNQIKGGFVQASFLYRGNVYFGAWNSNLYALDQLTGKSLWTWSNHLSSFYSPASLAPVAAKGRIFTVTPDHYITCFDAKTGTVVWRETKPDVPVWFSMGMSTDSSTLFVKTRNNKCFGISTSANQMKITWEASVDLDDDSDPTKIYGDENVVFLTSKTGTIFAVSKQTSQTLWKYKTTNSSINLVLPISSNEICVSTGDGKIVCLSIN